MPAPDSDFPSRDTDLLAELADREEAKELTGKGRQRRGSAGVLEGPADEEGIRIEDYGHDVAPRMAAG